MPVSPKKKSKATNPGPNDDGSFVQSAGILLVFALLIACILGLTYKLWANVLIPLFLWIGQIVTGITDFFTTHGPGTAGGDNLSTFGGLVAIYLIFAVIVYAILSLLDLSTGWKIVLALALPLALYLYATRRKWQHVGGGYYREKY